MSNFDKWLAYGQIGEQLVANVYRQNGWFVQPSFAYQPFNSHGPAFQGRENDILVADLDAAKDGERCWVEVKSLWQSPYYRNMAANTHGVSDRCWSHYCFLEQETGTPVTLAILEVSTGILLVRKLSHLREIAVSCGCAGCRSGGICTADQGKLVYFARREFLEAHTYSDAEMADIRAAHPTRGNKAA